MSIDLDVIEWKYHTRHVASRRQGWAEYFRHRIALHEDLARENREKLGRLIDSGAGRGSL